MILFDDGTVSFRPNTVMESALLLFICYCSLCGIAVV